MSVQTLNIPNLITLGRVILVPFVIWLIITGNTKTAFFAFALAGFSDAVDGFLAKRYGWQTELGAFLDPLADKLLLVSIFISLGVMNQLPSWFVIAVVSRDILIVAAVLLSWVLDQPVKMKPLVISKINTAAQIILAALVLADDGFQLRFDTIRLALLWLTAALTLYSLASYLRSWLTHMSSPQVDQIPRRQDES